MVTKAKINFNDNNYPDLGSITADESGDLILLSADISKLNDILIKENISKNYGVEFPYKSGDIAFVTDATRIFMYENSSDTWYELG